MDEQSKVTRREFIQGATVTGLALAASVSLASDVKQPPAVRKTRSYNPNMEYRQLGKTGLWVSAVSMGGHWKRVDKMIGSKEIDPYSQPTGDEVDAFHKNRSEIISACIDHGINFVDACSSGEILAYSRALKGRRDSMFMAYSWYEKEMRYPEYRTAKALLRGLDEGLKEAGLEYADVWRVTCLMKGSEHTKADEEELAIALASARKQGKAKYTGVSSHDRPWLKALLEKYPEQIQVIFSPYTADSEALPDDSIFDAVIKHRVGFMGIKPFASNSLFKGDSSPNHPDAAEDDRRARLAIRYILSNPAITAPIPGLISRHQVENVALAVKERRQLRAHEKAELKQAGKEMWANLPEDYEWLKEWRYV